MNKEFDPEMDALNGRKMKSAMKIIVSLDPETGEVSAAHEGAEQEAPMNEDLISGLAAEQGEKDKADQVAAEASDETRLKDEMMGGMSSEDTMEEFKNKAPKSLGQRVRFDIAKKAKPV